MVATAPAVAVAVTVVVAVTVAVMAGECPCLSVLMWCNQVAAVH